MTNHEIEKLAKQYAQDNPSNYPYDDHDYDMAEAFKAGYLKGVEVERERCMDIVIEEKNSASEMNDEGFYHMAMTIDCCNCIKEQIDLGKEI